VLRGAAAVILGFPTKPQENFLMFHLRCTKFYNIWYYVVKKNWNSQ